ncbi:MAG: hypothetical protein H0X66_05080 [Verrucomicrobia bacterium]|nr:hypothetical protein [Verrucomicrobiota bacterium]
MARCSHCSSIFFGGVREGNQRFCNTKCQQDNVLTVMSNQIPSDIVRRDLIALHQSNCPRCAGPGPVDLHTAYFIWSFLVITRWSSSPRLCCRSCGRKGQVGGILFSFFFGWWGFPWGIIGTPVQIFKNIGGMFGGPNPAVPSKNLEQVVRISLASTAMERGMRPQPTPPVIAQR